MKAIKKLASILEGWAKDLEFIEMTEEEKAEAKRRAEICSACPLNVANKCSRAKGGCGCPISKKTKSFNESNVCPKNKW